MKRTLKSERPSASSNYWRRLSDEQLLRIQFTTDDPEQVSELVLDVPQDADPIVEMAYDFRGQKRALIRCAHCKYPNHKAGLIIRTTNGARFLCGRDCGEKIYGADFDAIYKDFRFAKERASHLRRLVRLHKALPPFIEFLAELRDHPAFNRYQDVRNNFIRSAPRLYSALEAVMSNFGGALYAEELVRDFKAEERERERYAQELANWNAGTTTERKKMRRQGLTPRKAKLELWKRERKHVGSLPKLTLFMAAANPRGYIVDIARQFETLAAGRDAPVSHMNDAEKLRVFGYQGKRDGLSRDMRLTASFGSSNSNSEITNVMKQVEVLVDRVESQIDRLEEVRLIFNVTTLALIADWANRFGLDGVYKVRDKSIVVEKHDGDELVIALPRDFAVPSKSAIETFRTSVYGSDD